MVAFKRFLEYASGNEMWDENIVSAAYSEVNNPLIDRSASYKDIAEDIASRLESEGYSCDTFIGRSSFKVDIGVADKGSPDVYKLGILLDGHSYFASKTTSAREVSQPSLLKGLGWRLLRVRVIEWWESPDRVMEEIFAALNAPDEKPAESEPETASETEVASEPEVPAEKEVPSESESSDAIVVPAAEEAGDASATEVADETATPDANAPSSWDCECGAEGNIGKFCSNCGKPAPAPSVEAAPEPVVSEEEDVKKN